MKYILTVSHTEGIWKQVIDLHTKVAIECLVKRGFPYLYFESEGRFCALTMANICSLVIVEAPDETPV